MAISTPRRFKSRHGTYGVRFLVPKHAQAAVGKKEIRISLRTRDPEVARQLALQLCLEFERRRMSDRKKKPDEALSFGWVVTYPSGKSIEIKDDADQERFVRLAKDAPDVFQELTGAPALAAPLRATNQSEPLGVFRNPLSLRELVDLHLLSLQNIRQLDERTLYEKSRVFEQFMARLLDKHGLRSSDLANSVTGGMVTEFLEFYAQRRAELGGEDTITPRTLAKVTGHLAKLFRYAKKIQATETDLSQGIHEIVEERRQATRGDPDGSYLPLSDTELRKIFDPTAYLGRLNRPDYFWVPLLALTLGARLSEIVTARIGHVLLDESGKVWLFDITQDRTKNKQSVRRVPLPQQIIDAGFLEYRSSVSSLGAELLFPFGNITGPTWRSDPGKNVSRSFGSYLDARGISDPRKVFHSLRKNVISMLNALNVPSGDRRAIVGHASDGEAATNSGSGGQDVHFGTYVRTELITVDGVPPMERFKGHLDNAAGRLPIDWNAFKIAAGIVLDTIESSSTDSPELRGGWHTNAAATCAKNIARLQSRLAARTL